MKTADRTAGSLGQGARFEEEDAGAAALVSVAPGEQPLSAEQRKFNRLSERVRCQREMLAAWEAYAPRFRSRVAAELEPLERELRALQRRVVRRLDELLAAPREGERLSRAQRAKARAQILALVDELLQEGADAKLEVLYDRYGELSRSEQRRMREELMDDVFAPRLMPLTPRLRRQTHATKARGAPRRVPGEASARGESLGARDLPPARHRPASGPRAGRRQA
jgi:hypothetical protein